MNHTPTPWHLNEMAGQYGTPVAIMADNDDSGRHRVATFDERTTASKKAPQLPAIENANHMLKCVNAHDELVAALKELDGEDLSDARHLATRLTESNHKVTGTEADRIAGLLRAVERAQRVARAALAKVAA